MIKAVMFDLDGVLVHTDKLHYAAWKSLANREGIYFDEIINKRLLGVSRMASLEIILERANKVYSQDEKEELAATKNAIYVDLLKTLEVNSAEHSAKIVLDTLTKKGYQVAIGSSSKNARYILEKLQLTHYFATISDGIGLVNPKPNPEVFLKAAIGLGLKPEECIVVEDAKSGIEGALKGGFKTIAIGDAYDDERANYHIKDLKEILNIIK